MSREEDDSFFEELYGNIETTPQVKTEAPQVQEEPEQNFLE